MKQEWMCIATLIRMKKNPLRVPAGKDKASYGGLCLVGWSHTYTSTH